jgi:hypothetical protein
VKKWSADWSTQFPIPVCFSAGLAHVVKCLTIAPTWKWGLLRKETPTFINNFIKLGRIDRGLHWMIPSSVVATHQTIGLSYCVSLTSVDGKCHAIRLSDMFLYMYQGLYTKHNAVRKKVQTRLTWTYEIIARPIWSRFFRHSVCPSSGIGHYRPSLS